MHSRKGNKRTVHLKRLVGALVGTGRVHFSPKILSFRFASSLEHITNIAQNAIQCEKQMFEKLLRKLKELKIISEKIYLELLTKIYLNMYKLTWKPHQNAQFSFK